MLFRSAWRRFQVRISLPLPTQKELATYIGAFVARFEESPSLSPLSIAKSLGAISYAEAEQFCLDVRRRQVLAIGQKNLKSIVAEQLKIWTDQTRAKQLPEGRACNGDASAAASSDT